MELKSKLKEISRLLGFGIEEDIAEGVSKDAKLKDGITLVRVEGEEFAKGLNINVIDEAGVLSPLLAGEYELEDGTKLVVVEDGVIDSVEPKEEEVEVEEPVIETEMEVEVEVEEPKEEEPKEDDKLKDLEARVKAIEDMLLELSTSQEAFSKVNKLIFEAVNELGNGVIEAELDEISKFSAYKEDKRSEYSKRIDAIASIKNKRK